MFDDQIFDELWKASAQIIYGTYDSNLVNEYKQLAENADEYDTLNETRIAERSFKNSCRFHVGCGRPSETKPGKMRFHTAVGGG